jgi:coenzyme PQQ precursor peptide PqqA
MRAWTTPGSSGIDLALSLRTASEPRFLNPISFFKEIAMTWSTPAYTDLRLGFEVTMYAQTR